VLNNFKNLLFSFRWNKDLTINYLQWLITVVNDCVYYYLKHSEPVYAFHTLAIAEFYFKKIYHPSILDNRPLSINQCKSTLKKKAVFNPARK